MIILLANKIRGLFMKITSKGLVKGLIYYIIAFIYCPCYLIALTGGMLGMAAGDNLLVITIALTSFCIGSLLIWIDRRTVSKLSHLFLSIGTLIILPPLIAVCIWKFMPYVYI